MKRSHNKDFLHRERRMAELLSQAVELNASQRTAFLDSLAGEDVGLRPELATLLVTPIPGTPAPDTIYGALRLAARTRLQSASISAQSWKSLCDSLRKASGEASRLLLQQELGDTERCSVHAAYDLCMHRRVAVKQLKQPLCVEPNEATIRFVREITTMANLRHPHILPLLDYGVTGTDYPYFSTYLMEGDTLAATLGKPLKGHPLDAFITRLATIANAVDSAHNSGYLHRDIKPENILLDSEGGNAYLADWGVASDRLLTSVKAPVGSTPMLRSGSTVYGASVGTVWYMAPEQARGESEACDERSDVYSLGAILYEGLSGSAPLKQKLGHSIATSGELTRLLANPPPMQPPPNASKELACIALKALSSEKARRYTSAKALAQDLRAWQEKRPVAAQGKSLVYRSKKRIQRHPGMASVILLALLAGGLGLAIANARTKDSNARLRSQAVTSGSLIDFLTNLFERANAGAHPNEELSARDLLEAGSADIQSSLLEAPVARARMQLVIGENLRLLQSNEKAIENIEEAYATIVRSPGASPTDRLIATTSWAATRIEPKARAAAFSLLTLELSKAQSTIAQETHAVLNARKTLGLLEIWLEKPLAAKERFKALVHDMQSCELPVWQKLEVRYLLSTSTSELGDVDAAIVQTTALLEDYDRLLGEYHPRSGPIRQYLAGLYNMEYRYQEAAACLQDVINFHRKYFEADHPNVLVLENSRVNTLMESGDFATALPEAESLYHRVQEAMGEHSSPALHSGNNYAICLAKTEDGTAAVVLQLALLKGWESISAPGDPSIERARVNLASALVAAERTTEALKLCKEAQVNLPKDHDFAFHARLLETNCLLQLGDSPSALTLLQPLQKQCLERFGAKSAQNRKALRSLSKAFQTCGQGDKALIAAEQLLQACTGHPIQESEARAWLATLQQ